MNTENSEAYESNNKFLYQFIDKLNLKNPNNKNIRLVNLSIYYTWENIKSAYNKNEFKILTPTWNEMDHIQTQRFKTLLSTLLKNMRL